MRKFTYTVINGKDTLELIGSFTDGQIFSILEAIEEQIRFQLTMEICPRKQALARAMIKQVQDTKENIIDEDHKNNDTQLKLV